MRHVLRAERLRGLLQEPEPVLLEGPEPVLLRPLKRPAAEDCPRCERPRRWHFATRVTVAGQAPVQRHVFRCGCSRVHVLELVEGEAARGPLTEEVPMVPRTRAKFYCAEVKKMKGWDKENPFLYSARLTPVTSGSPENEQFYKFTPGGSIELSTIREDHFQVGQESSGASRGAPSPRSGESPPGDDSPLSSRVSRSQKDGAG